MTMVPMDRTGALKVNVTRVGTTATVDPLAGDDRTRTSCASAAPALPARTANTARTLAMALGRQCVDSGRECARREVKAMVFVLRGGFSGPVGLSVGTQPAQQPPVCVMADCRPVKCHLGI